MDGENQAANTSKSTASMRATSKYAVRERSLRERESASEHRGEAGGWPKAGSERLCARALMAMDGENQAVYRRAMHLCARANTTFAGAHCERERVRANRDEEEGREQAANVHVHGWVNIALAGAGTTATVVVPVGTCASQAYEKHEI